MIPADYKSGYFQNARPEMRPFLPQKVERMLEVGCGEGEFGAWCKQTYACECWGLEIDPVAAGRAAARLDRVMAGDAIEQAGQVPQRHFDLVVCNDVLEHFADPEALLVQLGRALRPDGVIVCSIPNIRYYKALITIVVKGDFPRDPSGIFDRTHLRFFTRKAIEAMFARVGYRVDRLEGVMGSRSRGLAIANFLCFGALEDCRYPQFACVARPPTS